jgi:hypothetical protein
MILNKFTVVQTSGGGNGSGASAEAAQAARPGIRSRIDAAARGAVSRVAGFLRRR